MKSSIDREIALKTIFGNFYESRRSIIGNSIGNRKRDYIYYLFIRE